MTDDEQQKLTLMIVELSAKCQTILDKQEELAENVSQIKEAVYNPDQGLYARLKDLDMRLQHMEHWQSTAMRFMWIVGATLVGLLLKTGWDAIF